jgi:thiol-disulfide isomerase/thioredoxin
MKLQIAFLLAFITTSFNIVGQRTASLQPGRWQATLVRKDSIPVSFNMELIVERNKQKIEFINATERITATNFLIKKDSVLFSTPLFESTFKTTIQSDGSLKGIWIKGTSSDVPQQWVFYAWPNKPNRFEGNISKTNKNISGRWKVAFTRANNTQRPAIAEFKQTNNQVTGTFLTPSGDYRFLEGVVSDDTLKLSTFDAGHVYYFTALITDSTTIRDGIFYSGYAGKEKWIAQRDPTAEIPDVGNTPFMKEGYETLQFSFPDLKGRKVSLNDRVFVNKVVVLQLMGSWCPNCMDETNFLSNYYQKNKHRGVEIIALSYEVSTSYKRSQASLQKLQQRFNVQYPILITNISISDSLKAEKTLPGLSFIKVYPTLIFIGRDGKVKDFHTGFYGPGSGEYYGQFKSFFNDTIEKLLK